MAKARLYQPAKSAAQSGRGKTKVWRLDMVPTERKQHDPLMGWAGSGDMEQQIRLSFPSRESAIAYCEQNGIDYQVFEPRTRIVKPKAYSDNFISKT